MEVSQRKYQILISLCFILIVLLIGLNIKTSHELNRVLMEKNKSTFNNKKLEAEKINLEQEKEELENELEDFEYNQ